MTAFPTVRTRAVDGDRTTPGAIIAFILGMGRSGSSAMARVMALCGGRLPESLLPANQANPTGFWEPSSAVHVNARFLKASGSSFFDTQLVQDVNEETALGRQFISEIVALLESYQGTAAEGPLIFKEPRISVLLPFWLAAVERTTFFSPRIVIPVRHPHEVATSLGSWKGLPSAHTSELWLKYNLLAERHTRHLPRAFVSYAGLMTNWRREVLAISKALGLVLVPNDEVDGFLDPELRHTVSHDDTVASGVPWLRDVYHALTSACRGDDLDVELLDAAFLDLSQAQARGSLPVVRSFGADFGVS
jgi:hypothetical protein